MWKVNSGRKIEGNSWVEKIFLCSTHNFFANAEKLYIVGNSVKNLELPITTEMWKINFERKLEGNSSDLFWVEKFCLASVIDIISVQKLTNFTLLEILWKTSLILKVPITTAPSDSVTGQCRTDVRAAFQICCKTHFFTAWLSLIIWNWKQWWHHYPTINRNCTL